MDRRNSNLPDKISLDYYDGYMHIEKKWFGVGTIFQSVFLLIWVGAMAYGLGFVANGAAQEGAAFGWIRPVLLGVVLLAVLYSILTNIMNKTDIFVSQSLMEIKIRPLPWWGNMQLETENIERFYTKVRLSNKRKRRRVATYDVRYVTRGGADKILLKGLETEQAARFIEEKIIEYLGMASGKIQ